ncbi:MAG: hypothetical protein K9G33_15085, partial [Sneathiella sp.]|nr:hypothetical protein [Sneathiella sp.]
MYNRYSALPKPAENRARPATDQAVQMRKKGALIISTLTVFTLTAVFAVGAKARGAPDSFADLVDKLSPAVVNISSTQTVHTQGGGLPQFPKGSPFEDFFKDFGNKGKNGEQDRKATSLGSGFVINAKD